MGNLQGEITTLQRVQTTDRLDRLYSSRLDKDAQLEPRVATTATTSPISAKFSMVLEMVRDLQTEVKALKRAQTTSRSPRRASSHLLGVWDNRSYATGLSPRMQGSVKHPKPAVTSVAHRPNFKTHPRRVYSAPREAQTEPPSSEYMINRRVVRCPREK